MAIEANPLAYLQSLAAELHANASRVRHLIGDAHFLVDGHHKEYVLHSLLKRFLPQGVICGRGFVVRDQSLEVISREQDLLLVDTRRCAPLFDESGVIITFPENVRAAISIKTTCNSTHLTDAVTTLNSIPKVQSAAKPWLGVFCFTDEEPWSVKPHLPLKWVEKHDNDLFAEWTDGSICVNGTFYLRFGRNQPRVEAYKTDLATALFIATASEGLVDHPDRSSRGIADLLTSLSFQAIEKRD